ncbi:MAG: hypothetical protein ACM309_13310 [Bacillota bacterium]
MQGGQAHLACFVLAWAFGVAVIPRMRNMMERSGHLRPNYAGRLIPASMGIPTAISAALASGLVLTFGGHDAGSSLPCLVLLVACAFAGAVDDVFGSGGSRGIAGHLRALVRARVLTTGILKAALILVFSVLAVHAASPDLKAHLLALDSLVVALAANFSNLLDLRPGRASKAYLAGIAALWLATGLPGPALVPVSLAGATLAGIGDDLAERSMLGDAGSNPLGAALGYWLVLSTSFAVRMTALAALVAVHLFAERHSITTAIERNPALRFLDALGRK